MSDLQELQVAQTWHYGLVARWWAEVNHGGDDIARFRELIAEPALDLGCGTGRLLVPYLADGVDVDGADASADMIALCQKAVDQQGLKTSLYVQASHDLSIERKYQSIFMCGAFAVGNSREQDLEGLRRIHTHLAPGGSFVFDTYVPNGDLRHWKSWVKKPRLPGRWPEQSGRRIVSDGTELELAVRVLEFDPLAQTQTREIRVRHYQGDRLLNTETYSLISCIYFKNELELMLRHVGFTDIQVLDGLTADPPRPWHSSHLMFTARRPV